ncbi:hypothetical protein RGQ29_010923 [Quercus rubra]|uniref:Uncharacterized protein n=1 Tax=Quercus rubra TaxID=3512 RepID=A0AAN7FWE2_QUERU|nr:hypothetical protein RGQ29_010923 [Quercus rubra]
MESSSSSSAAAKDVNKETVVYSAYNPCHVLEEALRAILKCLGVDTKEQEESSSSDQKDENINGTNTQDPSSTTEEVSEIPSSTDPDPPSSTTDPEADPPSSTATVEVAASAAAVRAPPRPPLSTGSGPQIN